MFEVEKDGLKIVKEEETKSSKLLPSNSDWAIQWHPQKLNDQNMRGKSKCI